jgi:arylsulfatase A-like enzyme
MPTARPKQSGCWRFHCTHFTFPSAGELTAMQAIILSFDSLAANAIGCYGNDWIETPNFDRLAATGIVFDRHFADCVGKTAGTAWASGTHSLIKANSTEPNSIGRLLAKAGIASRLITVNDAADWQQLAEFDDIQIVEAKEATDVQPDQVPLARLVKSGVAALNDERHREKPHLLWLHSSSPTVVPTGFDSLYFEDFEERGERMSELSADDRASHPAVYGGLISLWDHWLGELLNALDNPGRSDPTLVIVMSARGHLWHRTCPSKSVESLVATHPLCDQCIRAPLLIRMQGDNRFLDYQCLRSNRLVQTVDLVPTLLDWFGVQFNATPLSGRSWLQEATASVTARTSLWIGDGENDAIRTEDWLCIRELNKEPADESPLSHGSHFLLFAKPEDIWDVNDVTDQQPDLLKELMTLFPADSSEKTSVAR